MWQKTRHPDDPIWAEEVTIASIKIGDNAEIRVRRCVDSNGEVFSDVRKWWWSKADQTWKPAKGITLKVEEMEALAKELVPLYL